MIFYDNNEPFERPGVAEIERVYCFDWEAVTPEHWDRLEAIVRSLPGWVGDEDGARWFGRDEEVPPYLEASVEPVGLQVTGILPAAEFHAWHEAFLEAVADFPTGDST